MKKTFLIASTGLLAVFTATVAYADPSVTISVNESTNQAYIVQGIPGNGATSNAATIDQSGTGNKVGNLGGTLTLTGDPTTLQSNISSLKVFKQGGDHNALTVNQSGSNNEVLTSSLFPVNSTDNGSYQKGSYNTGSITQTGTGGKALLQQEGSYNKGTITQYGGDTKFAAIYQLGGTSKSNTADILQQDGNNQFAIVAQGGTSENATVKQYGVYNVAGLIQTGNNNTASITQFGNGEAALGLQAGSYNTATTTQSGGSANAAFAQLGSNNTVTIRQH